MLFAYAPVSPLGWLVFVELPAEEAYASLYDSIKRSGAIIFTNDATLHRHAVPDRGDGLVEPRRAVDDEEFGTPQPALDKVVEHRAPGLGALAAHALDRGQYLLAVRAYTENDQQRDRGRLAVEPDANDGAVEDQTYDRLLGQRKSPVAPFSNFFVENSRKSPAKFNKTPVFWRLALETLE